MSKKAAYQKKASAKIEEQEAKLKQARAKAKGASADVRIEAEEQIDKLEALVRDAKKKLKDVADAGEDAWEGLTDGVEKAWDEVAGSAKALFKRLS